MPEAEKDELGFIKAMRVQPNMTSLGPKASERGTGRRLHASLAEAQAEVIRLKLDRDGWEAVEVEGGAMIKRADS